MKTLTINLTEDNKLQLNSNTQLTPYDIINLTANAALTTMNLVVSDAAPELKQDIKEHLFDVYNEVASTVLAQFAPEIDLRPDFAEQAIMDLETKKAVAHINKAKKKKKK